MRSIAGLFIFILPIMQHLSAQHTYYATLNGSVIDASSHLPIEAATVSIFLIADSSLLEYDFTNAKGKFRLKAIPVATPCLLLVSHSGFGPFTHKFVVPSGSKELTLPIIQLKKTYTELEEIVVSARRPPVLLKNDTIEFDASSFKTPPNGLLEDLLKILPGLEVDDQGNITINGKRVSKITIDGKDFFGNDFKIATRNLPRDIIEKVQVMEYKSFEERFHNTLTGNNTRVINLTLKNNSKKGIFGRLGAGYGPDQRYEASGSLNYMKGSLQLNGIGNTNNVNKGRSSRSDYTVTGADANIENGIKGMAVTKAGGLNFGNNFGEKLRLSASHFFSQTNTLNEVKLRRQSILPDTIFFYNSTNRSTDIKSLHQSNFDIQYNPDTSTILVLKAVFNVLAGKNHTGNEATMSNVYEQLMNSATTVITSKTDGNTVQWELFLARRLKKQGQALSFRINHNYSNSASRLSNNSLMSFYQPIGVNWEDRIDQLSHSQDENNLFNLSTMFTEPLTSAISIAFSYKYTRGTGHMDKVTRRLNSLTGLYDELDTMYTNSVNGKHQAHAPNWAVTFNSAKLKLTLGTTFQWLQQHTASENIKNSLIQNFKNLFSTFRLNYRYSNQGNFNLSYSGYSQQPSMEQLQPVPDNQNILHIRLGNLQLKPSFSHNAELNIEQYNRGGFWNIGLGLNAVQNQIVEDTWFDTVQITQVVNSNGNHSFFFNSGFNHSWRKTNWSLRLSLFNSGYYGRTVSFFNKVENITHNHLVAQGLKLTYTYKELFSLMPTFIIRYFDRNNFSWETQEAKNVTKILNLNLIANWPRHVVWEHNLQYTHNNRIGSAFPNGVIQWNSALSYQFGKNKQAIIRLSGFDLLKQNTRVNRFITPTYIEDNQAAVLQRYFLLSFNYNIKKLK